MNTIGHVDIYGSVQPILLDLDYLATVTLYTFTVHTFNTSQHTSSKLFEYDSPQNDQFWAVITILLGLQLRKCSAPPCCVFHLIWRMLKAACTNFLLLSSERFRDFDCMRFGSCQPTVDFERPTA